MTRERTPERLAARIARVGLGAFGALWLVLGAAIATGAVGIGVEDVTSRIVVGGLLAADGAAFLVAASVYLRHGAWFDAVAIGLVALNLVLTVADDIGPADLLAFGLLGGLLLLLLFGRVGRETR